MKVEEKVEIVREALKLKKNIKGYRLGQAIYNLLPEEYCDKYKNLFYEIDEELVLVKFYSEGLKGEERKYEQS